MLLCNRSDEGPDSLQTNLKMHRTESVSQMSSTVQQAKTIKEKHFTADAHHKSLYLILIQILSTAS